MRDSAVSKQAAAVERLDAATCWAYVQGASFGRLAVINADGAPDIFPVNHLAHEGSIYFRTARDSKLLHIAHHPLVAFEVDGESDEHYWSVVIRGRAQRVTRDDEIRDSGVRALRSWSPTAKFFVVRVTAHAVTGRRFPTHAGRGGRLVAFEPDATAGTVPDAATTARGDRPEPIPHFEPRSGSDAAPATRASDRGD
ncbi:pyridoxamine 5'-phosphate oxidase family protein [Microbacterium atlanticum]|uniref:pyridoxamine 5'-phosphate oxidase family protein n=1 Tax=Microbacterium atlanticum TaxID=2782168 RepID=UPI001887A83F|nr:pyridoxamine 5'-phosphate oxidase family protein [Microbacterium atlanticum]